MSMILISGGSGSGKSEYAERRAVEWHDRRGGRLFYAATMMIYDEESRRRVARHREMRAGKGFETVETPLNIASVPARAGDTVLIECMSNLLANEMYETGGSGDGCVETITSGIHALLARRVNLVVVTNEVFSDGIRYDDSTMLYIRRLGEINRTLAAWADEAVEVVCGIPIFHKRQDSEEG